MWVLISSSKLINRVDVRISLKFVGFKKHTKLKKELCCCANTDDVISWRLWFNSPQLSGCTHIVSNLPPSQSFLADPEFSGWKTISFDKKMMMMIQHPVTMTGGQHSPLYGEKKNPKYKRKKKAFTNTRNCPTSFSSPPCRFSFRKSYFFFLSRSIYSSSNVSLLFALIQIIWLVGYVLLCVTRATSPLSNKHSREITRLWRRAMTGVIRARIKTFSFFKKEIYQTCSSFTILLMMADWQTLSPPPLNSRMFYDSWLWSACCYFFRQQTGRPSLPFSFPPPAAKLNYSHHSLL